MTNILLIDLSSIAHPLFHVSASNPNPNATSIGTVARVRALASGQPHVAVCCDSGRSFRRDIDPAYKANRPPSDATLQHQIALAIDVLKTDGFPVWAVPGFEADDLIATAVYHAYGYNEKAGEDYRCVVASADKDLLQLISDRVTVHKLTDGTQWTPATVQEKLGIAPNQMRDYLCLVGDASDNIKGAKGIGAKTAAALLAKYGTIEDLFAALTSHGTQFTPALATNLREFETRLEQVRALVSLRTDVLLPFEEVFKARVPLDVAVFEGDEMAETEPTMADQMKDYATRHATTMADAVGLGDGDRDLLRAAGVPVDPMDALREDAKRREETRQAAVRAQQADRSEAKQQPLAAPQPSHGLMVREPEVLPPPSQHFEMQLEPRSLNQAIDLAKHMHASRIFSTYGTPQAVLSTIMAGREIGLQSMASLRAFHVIEGKQAQSADLIRAQCLKSPLCEYFRIVERGPTKATWLTKRKGDPEVSLTYTIEEGRAAWQKDQKAWDASAWGKRPANMVTKTAAATLARLVYPDVILNMYCPEELIGEEVL